MAQIKSILTTLAAAFDEDVSPQRAAIYASVLGDRYSEQELDRAGRSLLLTARRFPTIAHFVEAIDGKPDMEPDADTKIAAQEQWGIVVSYQGSLDETAQETVNDLFGSWRQLGQMQTDAIAMRVRDFTEAYISRRKRDVRQNRQRLLDEAASGTTQLLDEPGEG